MEHKKRYILNGEVIIISILDILNWIEFIFRNVNRSEIYKDKCNTLMKYSLLECLDKTYIKYNFDSKIGER